MNLPSFKLPWEALWRVALLISIILAANLLAAVAVERIEIDVEPRNEHIISPVILFSAALYAGLLAIPFVPGVEVGLALIAMLGTSVVLLVYSDRSYAKFPHRTPPPPLGNAKGARLAAPKTR